jgi:hypothetical protein
MPNADGLEAVRYLERNSGRARINGARNATTISFFQQKT